MLAQKVIETVTTERAAYIAFVLKNERSLLLCVKYYKYSAVTIRESFSLPCAVECIISFGESKVFSALVTNIGYWQITIDESEREKTALTSHYSLYRFNMIPSGLKHAPVTLQTVMDVSFAFVRWQVALIYMDDIVLFLRSPAESIELVRLVLRLLYKAGNTLKMQECKLFVETIHNPSHAIRASRL